MQEIKTVIAVLEKYLKCLIFYTNLSYFIPSLFMHESHLLRNAIVDIMTNIIRLVLVPAEQEEDTYKEPREKFLCIFLQRITDKHAYCRSHVLSVLGTLAAKKIVPKKYLPHLMKAGIDRIMD